MERNIQILKYSCDYLKNKYDVSYNNLSRMLGKSRSYIQTTIKRPYISDELLDSILDVINEYIDENEVTADMNNSKYYIFQLEMAEDNFDRLFRGSSFFATDIAFNAKGYELIYSGEINGKNIDLDEIYRIFNSEYPADYEGRSLSVSDVVVTRTAEDEYEAFFCDDFEWINIPEFLEDEIIRDALCMEGCSEQLNEEEEAEEECY